MNMMNNTGHRDVIDNSVKNVHMNFAIENS